MLLLHKTRDCFYTSELYWWHLPEGETHLPHLLCGCMAITSNCSVCGSPLCDMSILVRRWHLLLVLPFSQQNRLNFGNTSVQLCFIVWRAVLQAFWWMLWILVSEHGSGVCPDVCVGVGVCAWVWWASWARTNQLVKHNGEHSTALKLHALWTGTFPKWFHQPKCVGMESINLWCRVTS